MRTWLLVAALALLPALGWSAGFSIQNPAIRNPIGVGTVPVSSYRNGLVTTPAPIDATADLSMTGNIRDGKHFRGNVPYRSTSDIGLDPGSSSLNSYRSTPSLSSFLRDTAGPEDFARRSSAGYGARPYYSPADAVARTVPGGTDVLAPQGAGVSFTTRRQGGLSAPTNLFALESARGQDGWPEQEPTTTAAGFQRFQTQHGLLNESLSTSDGTFIRGMPTGLEEVERLTPGENAGVRRQDDRLMLERLREQSRQPVLDLRQDSGIDHRSVPMGNEKYRSEPGGSISSDASLRDAVAARYRLSPMETFAPSTDSTPGQESVRQGSHELRTTPALTLGKHDDFVTLQSGGGWGAPGYAPPSQETGGARPAYGAEQDDVLGRIRKQLDDLSRSVESRLQAKPGEAHNAGTVAPRQRTHVTPSEAQPPGLNLGEAGGIERPDSSYLLKAYEPRVGTEMLTPATAGSALGRPDHSGQDRFESPTTASLEAAQNIRSLPDGIGELSRSEISAEAKRIMGRHESPDSFAGDKFSQHLRAAEDHLRAGEYYKAADSFALASVYRPNDPRALTGRSHALFAAGEYISSALFLSRALAIRPEYVTVKVDFVTLLGGPNRLAGRIADVEQWFSQSGSGRLQLLLGYIYYQTGRLNEAKRAVEAAHTKMPDSPAVPAIRDAINDAARIQ